MHKLIKITATLSIMFVTPFSLPTMAEESEQDIEVIEVTGKRSLTHFRVLMEQAQYDFYDMYNSLTTEEKFKIDCVKKSNLGSKLKKTVCEARYVTQARSELTEEAKIRGGTYKQFGDLELNERLKGLHREADDDKAKVIVANPALRTQFMKLIAAEQNYKNRHAEVFGSLSNHQTEPDKQTGTN